MTEAGTRDDTGPSGETSVAIRIDNRGEPGVCHVVTIIKQAWRIDPASGRLTRAAAPPLCNDVYDDALVPRLPPHSDFWPVKHYTDVAVEGAAFAPGQRPVASMPVSVSVGKRTRQIQVFGERHLDWSGGKARIGDTEAFVEQPLSIERAYGGIDFRTPYDAEDPRAAGVRLDADHPGLYPRNPWGRGYVVVDEAIDGIRLPTQEDPAHRLGIDVPLICTDPSLWYRQPLPAHFGWVPVNCFPRCLFLASDSEPWFPAPDDERLAEVRQRHVPSGYRALLASHRFGQVPHWRFFQEAIADFVFPTDLHGAPIVIEGMHPERPVLHTRLPSRAPGIRMRIDGSDAVPEPRLTAVEIRPSEDTLLLTYAATLRSPRLFIPGIHRDIPVAVSVDGAPAVRYVAPATLEDALAANDNRGDASP